MIKTVLNKRFFIVAWCSTVVSIHLSADRIQLIRRNDQITVFRVETQNPAQIIETSRTVKNKKVIYGFVVYIAENKDCLKCIGYDTNCQANRKFYRDTADIFRRENPEFDWSDN